MNFSIKKLVLAIACSTVLVACGGGGDSASTSGNTSNGNTPVNTISDLDKAKALINSAHNMVLDAEAVSTAYQNVGETWTFEGAGGLNLGLDAIASLMSSAAEEPAGTYTGNRLAALFNDSLSDNTQVQASSDAELIISANREVSFKGTLTIKELEYGQYTSSGVFQPVYGQPTYVSFENIKLLLPNLNTVSNVSEGKIFAQGAIRVLPTVTASAGSSLATLNLTGTQAHTVTAKFADNKSLQQRFDSDVDFEQQVTEATVHLDRVQVVTQSPVSTFNLTKLDLTAKTAMVDVLDQDKKRIEQRKTLLPTAFAVQGGFETAQAPATKGNLDLKVTLDNPDLNKVYYTQEQFVRWGSQAGQGYTQETESQGQDSARFAQLSLALNLKGELTTSRKVPFDVTVTAKRSQFEQPSYGEAVLKLNGETLTLKDKTTTLSGGREQVVITVTHPNGAFVDVTYVDDEFISAPVKVGSTVHGNINEISGGAYVAKFTDNTIIGL